MNKITIILIIAIAGLIFNSLYQCSDKKQCNIKYASLDTLTKQAAEYECNERIYTETIAICNDSLKYYKKVLAETKLKKMRFNIRKQIITVTDTCYIQNDTIIYKTQEKEVFKPFKEENSCVNLYFDPDWGIEYELKPIETLTSVEVNKGKFKIGKQDGKFRIGKPTLVNVNVQSKSGCVDIQNETKFKH